MTDESLDSEGAPGVLPTWRHPDTPLPSVDEIIPPAAEGVLPPRAPQATDIPEDE